MKRRCLQALKLFSSIFIIVSLLLSVMFLLKFTETFKGKSFFNWLESGDTVLAAIVGFVACASGVACAVYALKVFLKKNKASGCYYLSSACITYCAICAVISYGDMVMFAASLTLVILCAVFLTLVAVCSKTVKKNFAG